MGPCPLFHKHFCTRHSLKGYFGLEQNSSSTLSSLSEPLGRWVGPFLDAKNRVHVPHHLRFPGIVLSQPLVAVFAGLRQQAKVLDILAIAKTLQPYAQIM